MAINKTPNCQKEDANTSHLFFYPNDDLIAKDGHKQDTKWPKRRCQYKMKKCFFENSK